LVPGYYQPVPPGQSLSPIEGLRIKLALMGVYPGKPVVSRPALKGQFGNDHH
jgi:hypothetical protein